MAEEPKPDPAKPAEEASATSISPAPTEVAGDAKAGGAKPSGGSATPPPPDPNSKVQAEPLSDGTTPTVLAPGSTHRSVVKGKAGLTSIYRKADIMTTLLTFAGAVVAGGIIIGGYVYFNRAKAPAPVATPKVTTLNKADLDKLTAFFNGNSAGSSAEVLTISSSSLFKNRVAIGSDLKVTGGIAVDGTTALGDLTVDKTSTLGVTNIRGQLSVSGPLTVQNAALFNAGATFKGDVSATGNGSFGGSLSAGTLSVRDLSVTGTFNLAGHLSMSGQTPSATPMSSAGTGASADVQGNDAAGTVTVNTGTVTGSAIQLVTINFRSAYVRAPTVIITPNGPSAGTLSYYIIKTATFFIIGTTSGAASHNTYSFDYWVVQ